MKVGIVCGLAESAKLKASQFYDGILAAGHEAKILTRVNLGQQNQILYKDNYQLLRDSRVDDIDFFISCAETATEVVAQLNEERGFKSFDKKSASKARLHKLSSKFDGIECWKTLEKVPANTPIFIKPEYGTGSIAGAPWAYKAYQSVDHFKSWLKASFPDGTDGIGAWKHAQKYPGLFGRYIIQRLESTKNMMGISILNDGESTPWLQYEFDNYAKGEKLTSTIVYGSKYSYGLEKHVPPGHFSAFQYTLREDKKPLMFDFNMRLGAYWSSIYHLICPDFYTIFFNNFLNQQREKYSFLHHKFLMTRDYDNKEKGVIIRISDYPQTDKHDIYKIIFYE